jgi:general secretion pathway protein H
MRTSVPGSEPHRTAPSRAGFTLIELMVVLAIVAISVALVTLALPDGQQKRLDEEAARLSTLLESARAQSRAAGIKVTWAPMGAASSSTGDGTGVDFQFQGLPVQSALPTRWLNEGVAAEVIGSRTLVLGPEPLIGAQRVVLRLEERRAVLATDGVGPFMPVEDTP